MKRFLLLLIVFISLFCQTSLAAVYSINIGATEDTNAFGTTWEGFFKAAGMTETYSNFSFAYTSLLSLKPTIEAQSGFAGDITSVPQSLTFWRLQTGSSTTPYYLYSYSETGIPVISQYINGYGTVEALMGTGTVKLDGTTGQDYYYSVYKVNLSYVSTGTPYYRLGTYYTNKLNALQLTDVYTPNAPVPEPATLLLLGVGTAITQTLRKKRNSLEP